MVSETCDNAKIYFLFIVKQMYICLKGQTEEISFLLVERDLAVRRFAGKIGMREYCRRRRGPNTNDNIKVDGRCINYTAQVSLACNPYHVIRLQHEDQVLKKEVLYTKCNLKWLRKRD